ncbi:AAA family ATPase, partial [Patescibacteria group bacterium]|nr:AAA family ATPase [Patescibacteria group bacterium]
SLEQERGQERRQIWEFQKQTQLKQNNLNKFINEENNLKIELARIETRKEDLGIEIKQELGSTEKLRSNNNIVSPGQRGRIKEGEGVNNNIVSPGQRGRIKEGEGVNNENQGEINHKIQNLKHQLELIGGIDPEIAKEYEETKSRFEHLNNQIEDLKKACEHLEHLAKKLDEIIKNRFNSSFEKINSQFQKFFKELFDGGHAKLTYTKEIIAAPLEINEQNDINQENPNANANMPSTSDTKLQTSNIRESVEIEATPPGKRLKSVNMLSGGERALTSIALICAIIASNPSPFVVLDEVDAALDESNSVRLAKILERLSHKTQFVVITHNRATMEKARILYGVTMGDEGISKLLSIKLEEIK